MNIYELPGIKSNQRKQLKRLKRKQHLIAMEVRKKEGIFGEKGSLYEFETKKYEYLDNDYRSTLKNS